MKNFLCSVCFFGFLLSTNLNAEILKKIEVEFVILKRKHDIDDPFSGDRIQRFIPPHGTMSSKEAWASFNNFLNESFTKSGEYNMENPFPKTPGKNKKNCRWCEFAKKSGGPCDGKEGA